VELEGRAHQGAAIHAAGQQLAEVGQVLFVEALDQHPLGPEPARAAPVV
jgi:hypothetical protein